MPLTLSDDFSFLVDIRCCHQTKEAEKGVRRSGTAPSEGPTQSSDSASLSGESVSERQLLARKIRDIVNGADGADLEDVGTTSTGLNRQVRWTKTPGLYSPSFTHLASLTNPKSGNSANAKEVAQKAANAVIKKRRTAFTNLPHAEELSTAKVNALSALDRGSYGVVLIENDLMIGRGAS